MKLLLYSIVGAVFPGMAMAFTAPAQTGLGYDVYDTIVNDVIGGPLGFIGAVSLMIFGAFQIMSNWVITLLCVIAGTVIINAEALVTALGATI